MAGLSAQFYIQDTSLRFDKNGGNQTENDLDIQKISLRTMVGVLRLDKHGQPCDVDRLCLDRPEGT